MTEYVWHRIETVPEGVQVMTKIDDENGIRNVQSLVARTRIPGETRTMFFTGLSLDSMYVYYVPTHWAEIPKPQEEVKQMIDINPIQRFIDSMNEAGKRERANYHLTLGKLIEALEAVPDKTIPIWFDKGRGSPGGLGSYRGYYSDLAFETGAPCMVDSVLKHAKKALDTIFEGYKGGDFLMDADTPLWRSEWGECSGVAIMDIRVEPYKVTMITKKVD